MVKTIFILMLMISMVNAHYIETGVYNINNKLPIDNATLTIYNSTDEFINTTQTDVNGIGELFTIPNDNYTIYGDAFGYLENSYLIEVKGNETATLYLIPISEDGIIRLQGNELTLNPSVRRIKVYFKENNRLEGVYNLNDTIQLIINKEYIIRPEFKTADTLTGTNSVKALIPLLMGIIPAIGIIAVALSMLLLIYYSMKRRK